MPFPEDGDALGQGLSNRHSLSTSRGGFVSYPCRETGIRNPCPCLLAGTRSNDIAMSSSVL